MSDGFSTYVQSERDRISQRRQQLSETRRSIDAEFAELDRELAAIKAYEATKTGRPVSRPARAAERKPRRGSRRAEILAILRASPVGMKRKEIASALGVVGDNSAEMSISNALSSMGKLGQVSRDGGGCWRIVETMAEAAE